MATEEVYVDRAFSRLITPRSHRLLSVHPDPMCGGHRTRTLPLLISELGRKPFLDAGRPQHFSLRGYGKLFNKMWLEKVGSMLQSQMRRY